VHVAWDAGYGSEEVDCALETAGEQSGAGQE
jgi:hypothetical protein